MRPRLPGAGNGGTADSCDGEPRLHSPRVAERPTERRRARLCSRPRRTDSRAPKAHPPGVLGGRGRMEWVRRPASLAGGGSRAGEEHTRPAGARPAAGAVTLLPRRRGRRRRAGRPRRGARARAGATPRPGRRQRRRAADARVGQGSGRACERHRGRRAGSGRDTRRGPAYAGRARRGPAHIARREGPRRVSRSPVPAAAKSPSASRRRDSATPKKPRASRRRRSVHHSLATKPSTAAEEVVAPGAPSNSEVRAELEQMHAVERAARKQEATTTGDRPGGDSIGGNGQLPIPAGHPGSRAARDRRGQRDHRLPLRLRGGTRLVRLQLLRLLGVGQLRAGRRRAAERARDLRDRSRAGGTPGPGKWITVYANAGHIYMYVNIGGRWMRYDTVGRSGVFASRWQPDIRSNAGFVARHWPGL